MKINLLFTLALLCLLASCNTDRTPRLATSEDSGTNTGNKPAEVPTFHSDIRPGEDLIIKKSYTDDFEYVDYNDEGDDFFLIVKKGGKLLTIYDNIGLQEMPLFRGDHLRVVWRMDSLVRAGDSEVVDISEWAESVEVLERGKVWKFREKHGDIPSSIEDDVPHSDSSLAKMQLIVEYYLATTPNKLVRTLADDASVRFAFYVSLQDFKGKAYDAIRITNESQEGAIVQWLYLSRDLQKIYEADPNGEKLIEFK